MRWATTSCSLFFFNDTATTEIYTLSLHDALPICKFPGKGWSIGSPVWRRSFLVQSRPRGARNPDRRRSEEHTSELQSQSNLVCRLLLEKKNTSLHPRLPFHSQPAV